MSDGDALLAAVLAAPDDDAPRLVYADWLDEQAERRGEDTPCPRAAIIRIGCELERLGGWGSCKNNGTPRATVGCGKCSVCSLCKRLDRITGTSSPGPVAWIWPGEHWCWSWVEAGDESPVAEFTVARGFVWQAKTDSAWWLKNGPRLVGLHPITRVVLIDKRPREILSGVRSGMLTAAPGYYFFRAGRTPPPDLASDELPDELWKQRKAEGWRFASQDEADRALSGAALRWARNPEG